MHSQQPARAMGILAALAVIASPAHRCLRRHSTGGRLRDTAALERDPDVPHLPFADNPDPSAMRHSDSVGTRRSSLFERNLEGELIQPEVLLYDSHLRLSITGAAPTGTAVRVILFQENPTLDYYMVETHRSGANAR